MSRVFLRKTVCSSRDSVIYAMLSPFWGFSWVLKCTGTKRQIGIHSGVQVLTGKTEAPSDQSKLWWASERNVGDGWSSCSFDGTDPPCLSITHMEISSAFLSVPLVTT